MWVYTEFDPLSPPPLRKRSGSPKKNKRKREDEPKKTAGVRKHYTTLRCGNCKQPGHNARTCSVMVTTTTALVSGVTRGRGSQSRGARGRGQRGGRRGGGRARGANTNHLAGRGRGGRRWGVNHGVIIGKEQGPNTNELGGRGRGSSNGRGKEPTIGKGKQPMWVNTGGNRQMIGYRGRGGSGQMSRFGGR